MSAPTFPSPSGTGRPAVLPPWLSELYPFTPRRFPTPQGGLSYLDEGQGDEAVLMVHGNPTWSFFYRNIVLALRGRYRCIVPDHLGCGLSDKPQDWTYRLPDHIGNLAALIDSLGLKKIHLIVHDWGGPIGLGTMLPANASSNAAPPTTPLRTVRSPAVGSASCVCAAAGGGRGARLPRLRMRSVCRCQWPRSRKRLSLLSAEQARPRSAVASRGDSIANASAWGEGVEEAGSG